MAFMQDIWPLSYDMTQFEGFVHLGLVYRKTEVQTRLKNNISESRRSGSQPTPRGSSAFK